MTNGALPLSHASAWKPARQPDLGGAATQLSQIAPLGPPVGSPFESLPSALFRNSELPDKKALDGFPGGGLFTVTFTVGCETFGKASPLRVSRILWFRDWHVGRQAMREAANRVSVTAAVGQGFGAQRASEEWLLADRSIELSDRRI